MRRILVIGVGLLGCGGDGEGSDTAACLDLPEAGYRCGTGTITATTEPPPPDDD